MSLQKIYDARLHHPSTILVCGPTSSGKSCFSKKLIELSHNIFQPNTSKYVILIYDVWQETYDFLIEKNLVQLAIKGIEDFEYLEDILSEKKNLGGSMLLIDDQAPQINQDIVNLFTIYSHHLNVTVILLT